MSEHSLSMIKYDGLSIVLPAYNRAGCVKAAILSIESNLVDGYDYEILLQDDGSYPPLAQLINLDNKRISYEYSTNKGRNYARRRAIERSKFDLIFFIDADDVWLPGKIGKYMQIFENDREVEYVCSRVYDLNGEGVSIRGNRLSVQSKLGFRDASYPMSTIAAKKSVLRKHNVFPRIFTTFRGIGLEWCEHYDLVYILARKCNGLFLEAPTVIYAPTSESVSRDRSRLFNAYIGMLYRIVASIRKYT